MTGHSFKKTTTATKNKNTNDCPGCVRDPGLLVLYLHYSIFQLHLLIKGLLVDSFIVCATFLYYHFQFSSCFLTSLPFLLCLNAPRRNRHCIIHVDPFIISLRLCGALDIHTRPLGMSCYYGNENILDHLHQYLIHTPGLCHTV